MESFSFAFLFSLIFIAMPSVILNGIISKRKGKNQIKYILLSIIPIIGFYLSIYLISFLDKDIQEKINRIYEKMV